MRTLQTQIKSDTVLAAIWMVGAIASFSMLTIAGRAVRVELPPFELLFYRSVIGIGIVVFATSVFGRWHEINSHKIGLHFTRNICHFVGQNLWFYALPIIPLAQLISLEFSSPIWVLILGALFLGDPMTKKRLFCAILGFAGVLIVARPTTSTIDPALISAALAAIGFAGSAVFTKRLTKDTSVACIMFWLTIMQAVFGLVCSFWDGALSVPSADVLPAITLVAFSGLFAHYCLTQALALAPAAIVMPMDFLRLPTITLLGFVIYQEVLPPSFAIGAILILGANVLNLRADVATKRQNKV